MSDGREAINELTLSNAAYLSAWTGEKIKLPMDDDLFLKMLEERAKTSQKRQGIEKERMDSNEYNSRWNTNW